MTNFELSLKSKEQKYNIVIDTFSVEYLKTRIVEQINGSKALVVISQKV